MQSLRAVMSSETNGTSGTSGARTVVVVGLGASAGGLEALERFFERMPSATGMAFVVVQHLSPDFKSLMNDILSRRTPIPVRVATDGMTVEADTIYLNPPKKQMIIREGRLLLTDKDPSTTIAYPIDHFLRSLASDAPGRSAAIIFSGTGSDGSRGVREIRRAGGLVIAQDPETAGFDGMPRAAIDTGSVDLTLGPEQMADVLIAFAQGKGTGRAAEGPPLPARGLAGIVGLLRDAYGLDFAAYKLPTIARRTERRIRVCGDPDIERYVDRLASDPEELDALYRDLLIGVTQFFRDEAAFALLEQKIIPEILTKLAPDDELRIWSAGCATGEEAYSLAIVVRECMDARGMTNPARIFATDVHREALRVAATGTYGAASLGNVSPQRRERFFAEKDGNYQVLTALRSMVVFAPHNVMRDVPFMKLDLVTCRNLLIYLQPAPQRRALSLFHFGLKAGGTLFLGPSETLADLADEFDVIDAHWKVFRKRRDVRLAADFRAPVARPALRGRTDGLAAPSVLATGDPVAVATYDALLDIFMPPSLLVGTRRNLVHTFGGASKILNVPEGRATTDAVEMLRDDLRVAVTGALQRVFIEHEPIHYRGLRVEIAGKPVLLDVTVREVRNPRTSEPFALVTFEEQRATSERPPPTVPVDQLSRDQIHALEMDLRHAKENLQTTIEELETSNEELQATNEELVASNEELQTTNEELHSVNEELFTVNSEFQRKISELTELTGDMDHLLASTEVHTLFLDRELRIRRFTPKIAELFKLVSADVGRSIDAFNHALSCPNLYDDVRAVVATGEPFERQVKDAQQRWFLLRVLPYRRGATPDGAVLTLIDISAMKRFELEARNKDAQLSHILTNSPHPVFMRDREGRFVLADESFRRLAARDPTGLRAEQIFSADVAEMLTRDDARIVKDGVTVETEETIPAPGGPRVYLSVKFPMRDAEGQVIGVGGLQTDVTSLKRAEAEARESVTRRDRFLATLSHELRNPLAAILNASRAITRGGVAQADAGQLQQLITERALHMSRLVDDLLDVARLTQDKLVLERSRLDLRSLVQGVTDEVSAIFEEHRVRLVTHVDDVELPVLGDGTRLHQLQVNLLANAARYTPSGGQATYTVRRVDDHAEICVTDSGEGIAPDMLERIFDLFVQAGQPGARGRDGGLGVGLALVRRIVELHGGSVSVASPGLGKGTEFRVRLPLATASAHAAKDAAPRTTAALPKAANASPQRPRMVLLVDDDESSRIGMRKLLEIDAIDVAVAADGDEALAYVKEAQAPAPDLVLLDIGLPGMDGYEVCQRMRTLPRGAAVPIFALTGFGQESDRLAAAAAGFDAHLTKPVDVDEVYARYGQHLAARAPS
jgi:two-component system, chemotaxis family, CheB/CheR fusion protein